GESGRESKSSCECDASTEDTSTKSGESGSESKSSGELRRYCARGRKRKFLIKRARPKVLVNKFWMTATNSGHLDNHH
ncbi:hypothetical protein L917_02669, partial [Phytophthora nicotianae]